MGAEGWGVARACVTSVPFLWDAEVTIQLTAVDVGGSGSALAAGSRSRRRTEACRPFWALQLTFKIVGSPAPAGIEYTTRLKS